MKKTSFLLLFLCTLNIVSAQSDADKKYRPLFHFTPPAHWMNDPNGMVWYNGVYHLFYQHYPKASVWGPMHWGHATSKDMIHWEHQPIALYPDSVGMIFSGSAVYDPANTSGFGTKGKGPLVAIFTSHNDVWERAGRNDFENQSLAYSNDGGKNWTKYAGNPVLKSPNIRDFRDPKVSWYTPGNKWVMTLAVQDRIHFYSSPDLKNWTKESEFGVNIGAHGGVWECPDLFSLDFEGKKIWVLIVNLNPGGPNKGSATQYFVGDFDGKQFTPFNQNTKWIDYGPDEYAGITWSNTGDRKIFLGWMSNWLYADKVPTESWRSATTVPRDLSLKKVGDEYYVASMPSPEINSIRKAASRRMNIQVKPSGEERPAFKETGVMGSIELSAMNDKDFELVLSNDGGEELLIGYDPGKNEYYLDRTKAGLSDFNKEFASRSVAPRLAESKEISLTILVDVASVELFADGGLTVMTGIFFPKEKYQHLSIRSKQGITIPFIQYAPFKEVKIK